jgi:hypothetical protein
VNNEIRARIIEYAGPDPEPIGKMPTLLKFGGTTRNPCEHRDTVCVECLESWSWDYWLDITPGVVKTFITRYGSFPAHLIDDPACHLRVKNLTAVMDILKSCPKCGDHMLPKSDVVINDDDKTETQVSWTECGACGHETPIVKGKTFPMDPASF